MLNEKNDWGSRDPQVYGPETALGAAAARDAPRSDTVGRHRREQELTEETESVWIPELLTLCAGVGPAPQ